MVEFLLLLWIFYFGYRLYQVGMSLGEMLVVESVLHASVFFLLVHIRHIELCIFLYYVYIVVIIHGIII